MRYSAGELLAAMSLMSSYSFSLAFLCHTPCSMSLEEPRSSAQTRRDVLITGLSALGASVVAPAFAGAAEEPKQGEGAMLLYDLYEDIKGDVTGKPKPEIVPKQGGYSPAEIAALEPAGSEKAYFAVGCYWGGEANFRSVPGVTSTRVGFMGGKQRNPDYEHIGDHLEVVEVVYTGGPTVYRNLLNVAARTYDFVDWGHRYERGIFTTSEDQYKLASASGEGWSGTPVVKGGPFYEAKMSHQGWSLPPSKTAAPNAAIVRAGLYRQKQHRHYAQDCASCAADRKAGKYR